MKLRDIGIGAQLRIGMGVILALVLTLGALAWFMTGEIWLQGRNLYEHPMQVRRALGVIGHDVLSMRLEMKDLPLARNEQQVAAIEEGTAAERANVSRQLNVLYERYLGPREDVAALEAELARWDAVREETFRLFRAGKPGEAAARIMPGGAGPAQFLQVMIRVDRIDAFARKKGDQLFQDATTLNERLNQGLAVMVTLILGLSAFVSWSLLRGIKTPLDELTAVTEAFRQGRMDARSTYVSANEFGVLAASFNRMAQAIQTETKRSEAVALLSGLMLREEEAHGFCREVLKGLLAQTGSQVGAIYFLNEAKTAFELFDSIGLESGGRAAFSADGLEGELGAALATRTIQHITDIPEGTRFSFATATGGFTPRGILTIPVPSDHRVSAVLSLASVRGYDEGAVRLVHDIWSVLTARVNGVLAFREIQHQSQRLEHQNRELDAQTSELSAQANELTQHNAELEMQKRQLDEANRLKSTFLSNMSHELRTPLNSVIALSGVLGRRLEKTIPEEELGYLEVIERNGRNLLTLINDILDLSRIEAGREEINVSPFSIRESVGDVVAVLAPQAAQQGLALENLVPEDLPPLTSDHDKFLHILQNLVGNAVKFTPKGSVEISARQVGADLHLAVRDTGIGIRADQLPFIFDEFRQADGGASRKFGGSGLGLAIASKYALLLGGAITVESAPGEGSTFTLVMPMDSKGVAATARIRRPSASGASAMTPVPAGEVRTILVVEDSEPAIIQLTDILTRQGYRLRVAKNGREALAEIEQAVPDGMILDLMMPGVDGFEVLRTIRGQERTKRLPVLILSAKHVTREELSFLKGSHIQELIQKGDIDRQELLAAVARMVTPTATAPPAPPPSPARPARTKRHEPRTGAPVVLVVEDNPDSLLTAKALLAGPYRVLEAADGLAGVEQARKHRPDVILMDISMPVMDGVQALREIRKDDALRHIPVIALTASAMKGERETILAYGFDDYLSKPLDADQLKKALRDALD